MQILAQIRSCTYYNSSTASKNVFTCCRKLIYDQIIDLGANEEGLLEHFGTDVKERTHLTPKK